MASFWSFLATFMLFITIFSSTQIHAQVSTISAAPAFLPSAPIPIASTPTLSPDITPLFPTPKGMAPSPTESSLPTIPSSPSPPNPDVMIAPGPELALSPFGSLPVSSSVSAAPLKLAIFLGFLLFCLMQLTCM
ncbi:classical arabinogalactan protein 26 [Pistacia vera]|uniref:classical arabinogalactan protein 26 n=1 Tax=Pistacia vera TaxID=55513 RepID=UPI001263E6E4|nr:classical arabinogalactan protein 26 [Pistacia vera]